MVSIIGCILLGIASVIMVVSVILVSRSKKIEDTYSKCTGVITGFKVRDSSTNDYSYRTKSPVIQYRVEGEEYQFTGNYCSKSMHVGDKVELLYNSDNSKVVIRSGLFLASGIAIAVSIVIFVAGLAAMFVGTIVI